MTEPYTCDQVKHILDSPFRSSLLAVVEKAGSAGKFRLVQNCLFKDKFRVSVNTYVNSNKFPTQWGTAAQFAKLVSILSPLNLWWSATPTSSAGV